MEIITKFDKEDKVYFLTSDTEYHGQGNSWYPNTDEIFICEGKVDGIKIQSETNKEVSIIYLVIVWGKIGNICVEVHENMCSPDTTQLGLDVTNRYNMNKLRK